MPEPASGCLTCRLERALDTIGVRETEALSADSTSGLASLQQLNVDRESIRAPDLLVACNSQIVRSR
ncbi:hypothetical protein BRAS3809_2490012 [Bradyrhizobium sp. STM 3809]|nr:hypothetical protein BRAS3809_2490012 [Bradyrhizobium sp. STM 3809]